jgi:hypothetical protein
VECKALTKKLIFFFPFGLIPISSGMEFSKLSSLDELHSEYKEHNAQMFPNDEQVLGDAFSYGPYHEEEFRFELLSERLSDAELASLFLPVGHALIRGAGSDDHDATKVTKVYRALSAWQDGKLEVKDQLLKALSEARSSVLGLDRAWRAIAVSFFRVLETGINKRLGATFEQMHKLNTEYDYPGEKP